MFSTLPTRSGFVTKRALYFIRLYAQQPGRILKKLSEKNPARTYSEILVAYGDHFMINLGCQKATLKKFELGALIKDKCCKVYNAIKGRQCGFDIETPVVLT